MSSLRQWRTIPPGRFVETRIFTARIGRFMDDASYRAVQLSLMLRPGQGTVIPGTDGLRKMRWKSASGGKRGGLRLIYQWIPEQTTCYMLFVYSKNEQGDLTASQVRELGRLVAEET